MAAAQLKDVAVAYARPGLEIFPLKPDKAPYTVHGPYDATTDIDTIEVWWTSWPDALIGHRIPPDDIVIDVDPESNGMTTWKLLKDTYGPLPPTRTHLSGRNDGGGHLWFKRPPGKLSIKRLDEWAGYTAPESRAEKVNGGHPASTSSTMGTVTRSSRPAPTERPASPTGGWTGAASTLLRPRFPPG
jgi:hypothetical protein